MKRIPNRIMEPIDNGFQLCADTIEIDWRGNDKHICMVHLFIEMRVMSSFWAQELLSLTKQALHPKQGFIAQKCDKWR